MGRVGLVGPTGPRREKKRGREKEVGWAGKEERKGSKFCFVVFFPQHHLNKNHLKFKHKLNLGVTCVLM